jgi:hypothetical protein
MKIHEKMIGSRIRDKTSRIRNTGLGSSKGRMPVQLATLQLAILQLATLQLVTLQLATLQLATITSRHLTTRHHCISPPLHLATLTSRHHYISPPLHFTSTIYTVKNTNYFFYNIT